MTNMEDVAQSFWLLCTAYLPLARREAAVSCILLAKMKPQVLFGTGNAGKIAEAREVFGTEIDLVLPSAVGISSDFSPEEDGTTFEENAEIKARAYAAAAKDASHWQFAMAEDSGLFVDALPGEMGVRTRRWGAGPNATDADWLAHFLRKMEGVQDRSARFVCVACVVGRNGEPPQLFRGECRGVITKTPEAPLPAGIPVSACFRPRGCNAVFAALPPAEKNTISHRGNAMLAAKKAILESIVR